MALVYTCDEQWGCDVFVCVQSFEDLQMYTLVGTVCGLAIYNSTIVDLNFPLALYKKLLSRSSHNWDLASFVTALFLSPSVRLSVCVHVSVCLNDKS